VTSLTVVPPGAHQRDRVRSAPSLFDGVGGEPTLDEVLAGVWEGLAAHRIVSCPACGADMQPRYGAPALPIGGQCRGCGATLS
jgi:hypothetical protein